MCIKMRDASNESFPQMHVDALLERKTTRYIIQMLIILWYFQEFLETTNSMGILIR